MATMRDMLNIGAKTDLINWVVTDEVMVAIGGNSAYGDAVIEYYRYDSSSTATPDGDLVIKPTSVMGAGRFLRLTKSQYQSDWTQSSNTAVDYIKNKPTFSTVAISGDYNDLTNKPSIPSSQVNSDWNSVSGVSQILNKPTIPTNTNQLTNGSGFITNTSSEILSNKTISGASNTITSISQSSITNLSTDLANKQDSLISGTNIKTINGSSVLGSGNLTISGEANTASNVGSGAGVFKQKSGVDLQFKSLLGTTNQINITNNTNDLTFSLPSRTMSAVSRSLVTTTSSTGFLISSSRDYSVNYSVYAQVTSALIGTNTADVYLEIAATNSTTPGDWTTISRSGISMAGLVSTSGNTQTVGGFVPAGYYVRIRVAATGANSGSSVFTYQVGQENTY